MTAQLEIFGIKTIPKTTKAIITINAATNLKICEYVIDPNLTKAPTTFFLDYV
jgi:hypothetical protein